MRGTIGVGDPDGDWNIRGDGNGGGRGVVTEVNIDCAWPLLGIESGVAVEQLLRDERGLQGTRVEHAGACREDDVVDDKLCSRDHELSNCVIL